MTDSSWIGAPTLKGGKGYAPCPLGALHYRRFATESGSGTPGKTPFLLLHQTPFGLAEYADVQPRLARAGWGSLAPDNPGYGMSDPPPASVSVPALADNLVGLLDHLGIERVILAGHHTGAAIGAAFAARHAERVGALILHGCPLFTPSERAQWLAQPVAAMELRSDGSHFAERFRAIHARAGDRPDTLVSSTWATLGAVLAGPDTPTFRAVFAHDMALDIGTIRAPTLVLSDRADTLHDNDRRVAAMRKDFSFEEFSPGGSFSLVLEPQRWVDAVSAFARGIAGL